METDGEPDKVDPVTAWRQEILEQEGFEPYDAFTLAVDKKVDLHEAVELIRSGCRHKTAMEILT